MSCQCSLVCIHDSKINDLNKGGLHAFSFQSTMYLTDTHQGVCSRLLTDWESATNLRKILWWSTIHQKLNNVFFQFWANFDFLLCKVFFPPYSILGERSTTIFSYFSRYIIWRPWYIPLGVSYRFDSFETRLKQYLQLTDALLN